MSRIYFHSPADRVAVMGVERARFGQHCSLVTETLLVPSSYPDADEIERYSKVFGAKLMCRFTADPARSVRRDFCTWVRIGAGSALLDDAGVSIFELGLNTAIADGAEHVKLAARIHGQCEVHGYVPGEARAWFAETIRQGLRSGFYRHVIPGGIQNYPVGWDGVIALAEDSSTSPLVMSYSVCDSFPSWNEDADAPMYWDDDMEWIKENPALRICPETIGDLFAPGLTAHHVKAMLAADVEE